MRAIEARGLDQRYGSRTALAGIDLDVETGEAVAVLGENGSGKTTLLRILATAARPAAGSLVILGLEARQHRESLRARIGYLAHAGGLYPALTALENLEFYCDLYGIDRARAGRVLDEVGLVAARRRRASELSRGMQQRLALGRSILHEPEILLLDEPDAGLDETGRDLLGRLARGRTLLLATHDVELANRLCGREVRLADGRLPVKPGSSGLVGTSR